MNEQELIKFRYINTIAEIEYSEHMDENWTLFHKGIDILKNRLEHENFNEFSDDERELLEEIMDNI